VAKRQSLRNFHLPLLCTGLVIAEGRPGKKSTNFGGKDEKNRNFLILFVTITLVTNVVFARTKAEVTAEIRQEANEACQ
jgi:hypothetical protein